MSNYRKNHRYEILYLTNLPSPYMVDYFNLLSKRTELLVFFELKKSFDRNSRWDKELHRSSFDYCVFNGVRTGKNYAFIPGIIKILLKHYKIIIITNPVSPTGLFAIAFLKLFSKTYVIESEGGFPKKNNFLKKLLKKFAISNASLYFSSNRTGDNYLLNSGAVINRIIRVPFSSIRDADIVSHRVEYSERLINRETLNILGGFCCLAVGRFITSKNYLWLIEHWSLLDETIHLYIVGEGEEYSNYKNIISRNKLKNVHLLGYMEKNMLMSFMENFDLFVHPTLSDVWGLVINEAIARGLPVLTTPECLSSEELIVFDKSNFVMKADDAFIEQINYLAERNDLLKTQSKLNLLHVRKFTLEEVVNSHLNLIHEYFGK